MGNAKLHTDNGDDRNRSAAAEQRFDLARAEDTIPNRLQRHRLYLPRGLLQTLAVYGDG